MSYTKMSPPPSLSSSPPSSPTSNHGYNFNNGSSRSEARLTATAKRQKYFRRLFKFRQMDFEYAFWQMVYLFSSPQKVYRNFQYRKHTKDQWARDDPAFLVLLSAWLLVSSIGFTFVLGLGIVNFFKFFLWVVFIDCIGVGLVIATLFCYKYCMFLLESFDWLDELASKTIKGFGQIVAERKSELDSVQTLIVYMANRYMILAPPRGQDVEWGYAFDVHLNAFFPLLLILHFFQLPLLHHFINTRMFISLLFGNTLWLIAISYYIYITFLGYSALPFLKNTRTLLYPITGTVLVYILSLVFHWNFSRGLCDFYKYRVF